MSQFETPELRDSAGVDQDHVFPERLRIDRVARSGFLDRIVQPEHAAVDRGVIVLFPGRDRQDLRLDAAGRGQELSAPRLRPVKRSSAEARAIPRAEEPPRPEPAGARQSVESTPPRSASSAHPEMQRQTHDEPRAGAAAAIASPAAAPGATRCVRERSCDTIAIPGSVTRSTTAVAIRSMAAFTVSGRSCRR